MEAGLDRALIAAYGEILALLGTQEDRIAKLKEFDEAVAADIPDWEDRMKEYVSDKKNAEECIKAIEAFHAKHHQIDGNGKRVYEQARIRLDKHLILLVAEPNEEGKECITIRQIPDVESMDLDELKDSYESVQSQYQELKDREPDDECSEEYEKWEDQCEDVEELIEEMEERIEELGGEV